MKQKKLDQFMKNPGYYRNCWLEIVAATLLMAVSASAQNQGLSNPAIGNSAAITAAGKSYLVLQIPPANAANTNDYQKEIELKWIAPEPTSGSTPASQTNPPDNGKLEITGYTDQIELFNSNGELVPRPSSPSTSSSNLTWTFDADGKFKNQNDGNSIISASSSVKWKVAYKKGITSPASVPLKFGFTGFPFSDEKTLTLVPVDIKPFTNMAGTLGDIVKPSEDDSKIKHFVTPKKSTALSQDYVVVQAQGITAEQITVGNAKQIVEWEGGTPGDQPDQRKISRSSTGKTEVKVKLKGGGAVVSQMNVWVVWSTITSSKVNLITDTTTDPQKIKLMWGYNFVHTIAPQTLFSGDRPYLEESVTGPNGQGNCQEDLSSGADTRWDGSRNRRVIAIPNDSSCEFGPVDYPSDDVKGNDDASTEDEDNDPYSNNGVLTGGDRPNVTRNHSQGIIGDTFEARGHFKEFTRLKLGTKWYLISSPYLWRVHFKFMKTNTSNGGRWANNGSSEELNNDGYTTP